MREYFQKFRGSRVFKHGLSHETLIILIFLLVVVTHFDSGNITSFDSRWSIHLAMSLIQEGNFDLDEYSHLVESHRYYAVVKTDGHLHSFYPVATPLLATPFVYFLYKLLNRMVNFDLAEHVNQSFAAGVELLIAGIFVAFATVFIYLISYRLTGKKRYALLFVFLFAYCTSAWSTASRALWQHGPSMLMLSISLYLILLSKSRPFLIQFVSIPLACSYAIRPTNSLSVLFITIYVLICYRRYFIPYLLWASTIAVPFLLYNWSVYKSILPPYYLLIFHSEATPYFWEAMGGTLFSPARGLFVYSPFFLLIFYGIAVKISNKQFGALDCTLITIIAAHWIAISSFEVWWGGHSFGPRYFADFIPYLIYFLIPAVTPLSHWSGWKQKAGYCIFGTLIAISFYIHYQGATNWEAVAWNWKPNNIDLNPERLWDWDDMPFMRNREGLNGISGITD